MPATASPFASVKLPASPVRQAREVITLYDARLHPSAPLDESLDAIEARFVGAETSGRLAQAVRGTVLANRQGTQPSARKTA